MKHWRRCASDKLVLRPFQKECVGICESKWQAGQRKQLVLLPVASGKTVIMGHVIQRLLSHSKTGARKVLVLAHRRELLEQTKTTINSVDPTIRVEFDIAEHNANIAEADVVLGSVQSLGSSTTDNESPKRKRTRKKNTRLQRYNPKEFCGLFIDEAHHAPAKSYLTIIEHFKTNATPEFLLWGCTATPFRTDQKCLLDVFEHVAYEKHIIELMREKYLCAIIPVSVSNATTVLPITKEDSERNDFDPETLTKLINTEHRNNLIIEAFFKHVAPTRKSTLVFGCNLEHCDELGELFRKHFKTEAPDLGPEVIAIVKGDTKNEVRAEIVEKFKSGEIRVLINCGVFTEGIDIPNIDSIIIARPTLSNILYYQMIGRGLRPWPGKPNCLVLDIVDAVDSKFYAVVTTQSLFGLQGSEEFYGQTSEDNKLEPRKITTSKINIHSYLSDEEKNNTLLESVQLDWQRVHLSNGQNKFVLPMKETSQFGIIIAGRKQISKTKKAPEYSWETGYKHNHTFPAVFQPKKDIPNTKRYLYTSQYLQAINISMDEDKWDTTTISMSENLSEFSDTLERFISMRFPDIVEILSKDAYWRKEEWTGEEWKLTGLGMPSDLIAGYPDPLTKGEFEFYANRKKIRSVLPNSRISLLDEELTEENDFFEKFRCDSKFEWNLLEKGRLVLPINTVIPQYIEVLEYLPGQYQVYQKGDSSVPIAIQESSNHLTEDMEPDGLANLKSAFSLAEAHLKKYNPDLFQLKKKHAYWKSDPATSKQLTKLKLLNYSQENISKGTAALLINQMLLYYHSRR